MTKRIAINGFGRIGRAVARILMQHSDLELVAINDPYDSKTTKHLFKYDSNFGIFPGKVSLDEENKILEINDHKVQLYTEREISKLPWGDLDIDIVLECTGIFRTAEKIQPHINQGAKKVLLSAPAKSEGFTTIVLGVNDHILTGKEILVSNASCTTNCLAPIAKVLNDEFKIISGMMTTIHSYTNDQRTLDVGHSDLRRARAAALSQIPTTTGAAKAVSIVLPELKGKLDGIAIRVPTPTVSIVDLVIKIEKSTNKETVNQVLKEASAKIPNILGFSEEPLVSIDYRGDGRSSIVDADQTLVIDDLVKVMSWYDNEWAYSMRLVELAEKM